MRFALAALALIAAAGTAPAAEVIDVGEGDAALNSVLYRPQGAGPFPVIVGLHGCAGLLSPNGQIVRRFADWGERLSRQGLAVLFIDSFTPRGLGSQCGVRERKVRSDRERVADASAARRWLHGQNWANKNRVSLLGWSSGAGQVAATVVNDWQVSGVLTAGSGTPYDIGYSYTTGGANVNLTGSPNYPARIRVVGDTGAGCSSDPYKQFKTAAFAGPTYGSTGTESGANLMSGCFDHTFDLSVARNIRLGGNRVVQFRADVFNLFNAAVINLRQTTLQMSNPIDQAVQNSQFNADGTVNAARLAPKNAGFGAATGAQAMRSVQVQLRLQF